MVAGRSVGLMADGRECRRGRELRACGCREREGGESSATRASAPYCSWSRLARSPLTKFIFVKAEASGTLPKATRFVGEAAHRRASTKPSSTRSLAVKVSVQSRPMGCVRGGRRPREKSRKIKDFIGARVETSSVRPSVGVRLLFIRVPLAAAGLWRLDAATRRT